jgi:threonine aldolase
MPIDLRSDTVTAPSTAMRAAMASAEVGDDVLDGDPTVRRLERRTAELLGTEDALFFPSGSMANQAAVALHAPPGSEALLDSGAHILNWEMGAASVLSGVQLRPLRSAPGAPDPEEVRSLLRGRSRFSPKVALLCIENTHNGAGGKILRRADSSALLQAAGEFGVPVHLDGARLWNAAAADAGTLPELTAGIDTVMVSFSKGLGAPVGAALGLRARDRDRVWEIRKRFGGGMRQAGIIAAGALYALENNLSRLTDDHRMALALARLVAGARGAGVVAPDTNIVMLDLPEGKTSPSVVAELSAKGILLTPWSETRLRAVTHLDVSLADVERAGAVIGEVLAS